MGCGKVSQIGTLTPEQTAEMAMVDLAHMLLVEGSEPMNFRDLMNRIGSIKQLSPDEVEHMMVQIYTEINLDGRFVNIGNSTWGLKKWYPVEQFDDTTPTVTKTKRKVVIDDEFEDLDEYELELEEEFVDEFEEDEVFEDEEEIDDEIPVEDDEEIVEEDFADEEDVELDFESDEESLEELAEEEDVEDEEM